MSSRAASPTATTVSGVGLVIALLAAFLLSSFPGASAASAGEGYTTTRAASPARSIIKDSSGRVVATLTDGSRSVVLTGASRTFAESTTSAVVTTTARVRLLDAPFAGRLDTAWLDAALADRSPDLLAVALAYVTGAPEVRSSDGVVVSDDASYGPLVDGVRQEGSDWNDYLGVSATYDGKVDAPEAEQIGALDCSGFVRMVFGARGGHAMSLLPDGVRLPRRAVQMATGGPGTVVVPDRGKQVTSFGALLAGDLVLFDASTDDGTAVDHVGIYLGKDSAGQPRFVSSRKSVDGPTMGDVQGRSTLSGTGLYAKSFRAVRRV